MGILNAYINFGILESRGINPGFLGSNHLVVPWLGLESRWNNPGFKGSYHLLLPLVIVLRKLVI